MAEPGASGVIALLNPDPHLKDAPRSDISSRLAIRDADPALNCQETFRNVGGTSDGAPPKAGSEENRGIKVKCSG